jgi:hypothetical protein
MGGKTGRCGYNAKRLSFCFWALLIFTTNAILIGNHLLHSLNRMVGCDGDSSIMRVRRVFLEPVISVVRQSSFKPLTIMCCHYQTPRKLTYFKHFPRLPVHATLSILNARFIKKNSEKKLIQKEDCH